MITWTAVALLSSFVIIEHGRMQSERVRSRAIADSVALSAALDPGQASLVAQRNHAVLRELVTINEENGTICVDVQTGTETTRSCAELLTPTLDD